MDKQTVLNVIQNYNHALLLRLRDEFQLTAEKIRTGVWIDGAFLEAEIKIDDKDLFEKGYQDFVVRQVLDEAKEVHKK